MMGATNGGCTKSNFNDDTPSYSVTYSTISETMVSLQPYDQSKKIFNK